MQNIPRTIKEVKSILVAWNLKKNSGFKYVKGEDGVTWLLLETGEFDFFEDVEEETDIVLTEPLDAEPGDAWYGGEPTMYYERAAKPGEVKQVQLDIMRLRAKVNAEPRAPIVINDVGRSVACSTVVTINEVGRKGAALKRPGLDVMNYAGNVMSGQDWKSTLVAMYRKSWYGKLNEAGGYAGKCNRKMRLYTRGNKDLAKITGMHVDTISGHLMKLKREKIILQHKRGYRGQKCSIWELPLNVKHIFAWKRGRA